MSNNPLIYTPDGDGLLGLTASAFVDAVKVRWPAAEVVWTTAPTDGPSDVTVRLKDPEDERRFQVFHDRELKSLWIEGSEHQAARLACWLRTLIPASAGKRVVLLNPEAWQAAIVEPGMTPEDVLAAWTLEPPVPD